MLLAGHGVVLNIGGRPAKGNPGRLLPHPAGFGQCGRRGGGPGTLHYQGFVTIEQGRLGLPSCRSCVMAGLALAIHLKKYVIPAKAGMTIWFDEPVFRDVLRKRRGITN
jgi:hypothetical protein